MLYHSQYCASERYNFTLCFYFRVCTQIVDIMFDLVFSSSINAIDKESEWERVMYMYICHELIFACCCKLKGCIDQTEI
jgi:hypothetical protein